MTVITLMLQIKLNKNLIQLLNKLKWDKIRAHLKLLLNPLLNY